MLEKQKRDEIIGKAEETSTDAKKRWSYN